MSTSTPIDVPDAFAAAYAEQGAEARAWLAGLPRTGGGLLERWDLRPDGPTAYGLASIVLPVRPGRRGRAAPKTPPPREETPAGAMRLGSWRGAGHARR